MSYEQIIDDSDAIFLAQVLAVSGTSSNQDNGRYWDGGLPVYTIELQILRSVVDTLALPEHVTVTQVAYSPLERGNTGTPAVGQRAVFFIVQTDIAWRDGLRTVLRTTNTDGDSIIVVGDDRASAQPNDEAARLEQIVQDIAERREILPQPQPVTRSAEGAQFDKLALHRRIARLSRPAWHSRQQYSQQVSWLRLSAFNPVNYHGSNTFMHGRASGRCNLA